MLTLVLWQHVVFLCVSHTVFRMSLVMVVRRMLCSVRVSRDIKEYSNIKFNEKLSSGSRVVPREETERDMK